jgi:uncharacterized membrane protein
VLSSLPVRNRLVAHLGERVFQGFYSLVVLGLFIPLVLAYFANKHTGPVLWSIPPGPALRWAMYVGIAVAFVLVIGSQSPEPGQPRPGRAARTGRAAHHAPPLHHGTALWALVHLLGNGSATDVAFFGGFVVFGLVGAWHQDQRKIATGVPGYREFVASTPFLPFTRAGALRGIWEIAPAAAIGIVATVVVRHFHASWFGG